jgi:hypothetical protein
MERHWTAWDETLVDDTTLREVVGDVIDELDDGHIADDVVYALYYLVDELLDSVRGLRLLDVDGALDILRRAFEPVVKRMEAEGRS